MSEKILVARSGRRGPTPNPDVMCNREIKFGVFLQWARDHGFAAVATGHYARREPAGDRWALREGADPNEDQAHFLALLRQEQAAGLISSAPWFLERSLSRQSGRRP